MEKEGDGEERRRVEAEAERRVGPALEPAGSWAFPPCLISCHFLSRFSVQVSWGTCRPRPSCLLTSPGHILSALSSSPGHWFCDL